MSSSETSQPTPRLPPRRILEDASGRRLQRMRWVGRAVALLFLIWLAIVILGGLGVGPVGRLPFGHVLRASSGPPPIRQLPAPAPPTPADLTPALPAPVTAAAAASATQPATHGRSAVAPGRTKTATRPGKSAVAPGRTKTTTAPGKSAVAPGRTKTTTARGKSLAAPGKVKRSTTTTATTTTLPGRGLRRGKKP